jgi:hypothetical protein
MVRPLPALLTTRRNTTQNACEVIILIEPNDSPTIGKDNLNYIKYHLRVNLPGSHISNLQSVLRASTPASNNLSTTKLVSLMPKSATEPGTEYARQFHTVCKVT